MCEKSIIQPRAVGDIVMPDVATASRAALIDSNIIHSFDADLARRNLHGSYGILIKRRYERMMPLLAGRRVLDAGCGIGLLSSICATAGVAVTSIDLDTISLELASELFGVEGQVSSVYDTGLPRGSIDAIVLFDVIEHLDFGPLFEEMARLGISRALVYESNLGNPLLRWHRRRMGHNEHREYTTREVITAFESAGFELLELTFENSVMLPATGGLQRDPLPFIGRRPALVDALDEIVTGAMRFLRLERRFCFRYFAVFDRL
jgi:SAM-dependent methyltransferase